MRRAYIVGLFVLLAAGIGVDLLLHALTPYPIETSSSYVVAMAQGRANDDSWTPMKKALSFFDEHPRGRVYDEIFFDRHIKFQYPPTSLLFLDGLRKIDKDAIRNRSLNRISWYVAWGAVLLCGLIFVRASRPVPDFTPVQRGLGAVAIMGLAMVFYPIARSYCLGQIQTWITCLVALSTLLWLCGHRVGPGLAMALCTLVKPQLGLVLVWALARKQLRFAAAFVATLVVGVVLSVAAYGWTSHVDYLTVARFLAMHGEAYFPNQSINGLLNRLIFNGDSLVWQAKDFATFNMAVYLLTTATSVALAACVVFLRRTGDVRDFGAAILASTLASPIAWEHHFGVMMPLFAALAPAAARGRDGAVLAVAYFFAGRFFQSLIVGAANTPWNFLQSYLLYSALLLLGWLWLAPRQSTLDTPSAAT